MAAAMIACVIPILFFSIIGQAEAHMVEWTIRNYITDKCIILHPWIPSGLNVDKINEIELPDIGGVPERNASLRVLAFQATVLVAAVLIAGGLACWVLWGATPLWDLMLKSLIYTLIFTVVELTFVFIVTRMSLMPFRTFDVGLLDQILEIANSCATRATVFQRPVTLQDIVGLQECLTKL